MYWLQRIYDSLLTELLVFVLLIIELGFFYVASIYKVNWPSLFEGIYNNLTLASDPDISKQHQKHSANINVT